MFKCTLPINVFLSLLLLINIGVINGTKDTKLKQNKFPPCKACQTFIESFKRGIEKTSTGKFEGGDTAWEEKKLGSYATSEVRLVEIQENVCSDVTEGQTQCYSLHEQYDNDIEDWWFNYQNDEPDLYKYFCVEKVKHCCLNNHYGPDCKTCPGYPDKVCSNNGKCKGSGTRKGDGKCFCNTGYIGKICNNCAEKYFESYKDNSKVLCSPCPISCEGPCTKAGCENCAKGWLKNDKGQCIDVNECASSEPVCGPLEFCVNSEGGFECFQCDKSCARCTGHGPDMCIKCARGFTLIENMCIDEDVEGRQQHVYITRTLMYIGFCIATCIIYQKSVTVSAIIGLTVAIYITVSEYVLNTPLMPNTTDIADKIQLN